MEQEGPANNASKLVDILSRIETRYRRAPKTEKAIKQILGTSQLPKRTDFFERLSQHMPTFLPLPQTSKPKLEKRANHKIREESENSNSNTNFGNRQRKRDEVSQPSRSQRKPKNKSQKKSTRATSSVSGKSQKSQVIQVVERAPPKKKKKKKKVMHEQGGEDVCQDHASNKSLRIAIEIDDKKVETYKPKQEWTDQIARIREAIVEVTADLGKAVEWEALHEKIHASYRKKGGRKGEQELRDKIVYDLIYLARVEKNKSKYQACERRAFDPPVGI